MKELESKGLKTGLMRAGWLIVLEDDVAGE